MQAVLERARDDAVKKFAYANLKPENLAATVIDITDRANPKRASIRGNERIYPASVVKLFYLATLERQMEDGLVKPSPLLDVAIRDMIVDSGNDPTALVVDTISGVSSGPELSDDDLAAWGDKRNVANRYFVSLGYTNINVCQKPWGEGPYGREKQWVGPNRERRNMLTTDAVARLIYEISTGKMITPARSAAMLDLMRRDPHRHAGVYDAQAIEFGGSVLPVGSVYCSKAGWTSEMRHDSAYIKLPNGAEYICVVFTKDVAYEPELLPFMFRRVMNEMLQRGAPADVVYRNGHIWTGDADRPWATTLAIHGQILLAVGDDADCQRVTGPRTRIVDLGGRFVAPGFIDDHTHFVSGGETLLGVNLRDAKSTDEFAQTLGDFAAKQPPGRWILGGDWDHEAWPGAPLPTRQMIDGVTPNNPVFVNRFDGHMGVANTAALKAAGITKDTPNPPGGEIVRDPATGEPTGVLKDAAMDPVWAAIPDPAPADLDRFLDAAMKEAARNGVTSIEDITAWNHYDTYLRAKAAGRLTVRVACRTPLSSWERQAKIVEASGPGDEWVKLAGFKAFADGSLGSTTAAFFAPYLDAPNTSGLLSDELQDMAAFRDRVRAANDAGLQVSVHAIGDRANAIVMDVFEQVSGDRGTLEAMPHDPRFRIEHAQHLRSREIGRMARLGVIASVQPYHAIDDGRWAAKRLDPARLRGTYAFRAMIDAGVPLAFGSDWTVAPISPILGIYAAVTRRTLDGKNPDGWYPEQKVTVEEALRAYTYGSAYASFDEGVKGRLSAGFLADFVVLSDDLFAIDPVRIGDVKVMKTVVGGREVYVAN